jgi:hypothetical protein
VKKEEEKTNFKLDPKIYREQLDNIELRSISLDSFSAIVNRDKLTSSMKTAITEKRKYEIKEKGEVLFSHSFELITTQKTKKDFAIKINCLYSLSFTSKVELTEDFWDIFKAMNLQLNTWPYFREFVQNTTQRMSVFPLTLPLYK